MSLPKRRSGRQTANPVSLRKPVAARAKYKVDAALARELRERIGRGETQREVAATCRVSRYVVRYWTTGGGSAYDPLPWVTREVRG